MGLFKKTESATTVVEPNEVDELRRQIEPLKVEIAALEQRLQQEKARQSELKNAYDVACVERAEGTPEIDLSRIRSECEDQSGLVTGLQRVLQRKTGELQPLETQHNALLEAQNEARARRAELEWLVRHGTALADAVRQIESLGGQSQPANKDRLELLNPPSHFCERALLQARRLAIGLPNPITTVRAAAVAELAELQDRLRKEATE